MAWDLICQMYDKLYMFARKGGGGGGGGGGFPNNVVVAHRIVLCTIPGGQRGRAAAVIWRDVSQAVDQADVTPVYDGGVAQPGEHRV